MGVVSDKNRTAVTYGPGKVMRQYMDGGALISVPLNITGMAEVSSQQALVERMTQIMRRLIKWPWQVDGASHMRCALASLPMPTVKNEHFWIYSCSVNITFFTTNETEV